MARELLVDARDPDLDGIGPLGGSALDALGRRDDGQHQDALDAPLAQRLDGGSAGPARRDDGVQDDGQAGHGLVRGARGHVLREVVVVLDGLEGRGLAVET